MWHRPYISLLHLCSDNSEEDMSAETSYRQGELIPARSPQPTPKPLGGKSMRAADRTAGENA